MNGITVSVLMALLLIQASKTGVVGFECKETSPISDEVFSPKPKIPMIHIFCGQIKGKKADGYHSAPNGNPPVTAEITQPVYSKSGGQISCCTKCDTKVRQQINATHHTWIAKNKLQNQCFFRWSIADTVTHLQKIYTKCSLQSATKEELCIKDYLTDKAYAIKYMLAGANNDKHVVSAYPVILNSQPDPCKSFYTYNEKGNSCK
ncbi:hypothetical protein EMCRGX_G024000 [Ephydatia muelleri]